MYWNNEFWHQFRKKTDDKKNCQYHFGMDDFTLSIFFAVMRNASHVPFFYDRSGESRRATASGSLWTLRKRPRSLRSFPSSRWSSSRDPIASRSPNARRDWWGRTASCRPPEHHRVFPRPYMLSGLRVFIDVPTVPGALFAAPRAADDGLGAFAVAVGRCFSFAVCFGRHLVSRHVRRGDSGHLRSDVHVFGYFASHNTCVAAPHHSRAAKT